MNFSVVLGISFFSVSHEYFFFYFFSPFLTYFKLRHTLILLGSSYQWFGTELYIKYYGFISVALSVSFILLLFSTFKYIMFIVSVFYHIVEWWHLMQNLMVKTHWLQQALAWDMSVERQVAVWVPDFKNISDPLSIAHELSNIWLLDCVLPWLS